MKTAKGRKECEDEMVMEPEGKEWLKPSVQVLSVQACECALRGTQTCGHVSTLSV